MTSSTIEMFSFLALTWCIGMGVGTSAARAGLSKLVSSADQGIAILNQHSSEKCFLLFAFILQAFLVKKNHFHSGVL